MTRKRLELVNEFEIHVSPTTKGVGVTIIGRDSNPSFYEFGWHGIIDDLIESHSIAVLKTKDVRISEDSRDAITRIAAALRFCSYTLYKKVRQLKVVDV